MTNNKISVITVVFNDVGHIRETIESFFSQTWEEKEYIVIDGGSTDGTAQVIEGYSSRLAYWCSEPDKGIYDAMNKGISHANGDWINILNSGDVFSSRHALEDAVNAIEDKSSDIIFGDSIEVRDSQKSIIIADSDTSHLEFLPTFRHGSALIRASVQKEHLFDTDKSGTIGFALDWDMLYTLYKSGYKFTKVPVTIQSYRNAGVSNQPYKSAWLNYKITSLGRFSFPKFRFFLKRICKTFVKSSGLYLWIRSFCCEYTVNSILPHIPFWALRRFYLKLINVSIGQKSFIMKDCYILCPGRLKIGEYSHINRGCTLDCRGHLTIGDNTSLSYNVCIFTGGHDTNSTSFKGIYMPITIEDNVWVGANATILQGVVIGKGAVICAGAVVTNDIPPYSIYGGVPARQVGKRRQDLNYHCKWNTPLT